MDLSDNYNALNENALGKSAAVQKIFEQLYVSAPGDSPLVIEGEPGTGKTTLSHVIHNMSRRSRGPFITADFGTIPLSVADGELFGYEKGAAVEAEKTKTGLFEIASGGTILLDEARKVPVHIRPRIKRIIEEKKICRLGSNMSFDADVRIIATNSTDTEKLACEKGEEDAFLFLTGKSVITIPPLRERPEDIAYFARKFFEETCLDLNRMMSGLSDEVLDFLKVNRWHGNIRELKNVIRRSVLLCGDDVLTPEHIKFSMGEDRRKNGNSFVLPEELPFLTLKNVEKIAIKRVLDFTKGKKTKAASLLKIDYKTLVRKMKEYNINI